MLERLSGHIVDWQIRKQILDDEEREVYQYAYELLLNQVINIVIAIVIAVIFRTPIQVIAFLISYIPLRSYSGGYHANTNAGCTIVSAFMVCFICWLSRYSPEWGVMRYYLICFACSGYFIIRYAPVEDSNKPLDEVELVRYKKMSCIIWVIETLIGCVLCLINNRIGFVIAISHLLLSVMLWLGNNKNRCKHKNV